MAIRRGPDLDPLEQSTAQDERSTTHAMILGATLEVVRGPDAGLRREIKEPALTIGKGPLAGLRLSDSAVSREHLRIELTSSGLRLSDGGSTNGSWVGGMRVERVLLTADTAVMLGNTTLTLTLDSAPRELAVSGSNTFGEAYACSLPMRHLFATLMRAAGSDVSILLEGESGVGKEVLARGIHLGSTRRSQRFVTIDCGAIPPNLIEAELFGYERGAFTGADRTRIGLFEQAAGGTVFLDEIGELPIEMQPKLLRVLQEREVRRVGSTRPRPLDVRVLAATNRNLLDRCAQGAFREDLFYRLAALRVRVPSLRERIDDIAPLATRFLRELSGDPLAELPPDTLAMLTSHEWPGNVRELRNVVTRLAVLDTPQRGDLFDVAPSQPSGARSFAEPSLPPIDLSELAYHDAREKVLEHFERRYFQQVIDRARGNLTRAAEMAKLARSSFYRLLERHRDVGRGGDT
jgi:DNA-binding NtrC family response regulator